MATNLSERKPDFFLLKDNHTPNTLGPGAYFKAKEPAAKKIVDAQRSMDMSLADPSTATTTDNFALTIAESAQLKKPGFKTSGQRSDIKGPFQICNPGPGQYTARSTAFANRFVSKEGMTTQNIAPAKVSENPGNYFTNDKGKITTNAQPFHADKSARQELIFHAAIDNPAPGTYAA